MSTKVSSPKQSRIPDFFFADTTVRKYIEYQRDVLFELWSRCGGGFDAVAGKKITNVTVDTVLDDTAYGAIVVVDTALGAVQLTLPPVIDSRLGESVIVSTLGGAANTTVIPASGTVLGAGSVVISTPYDKIRFSPIDTTAVWIEI